MSDNDDERMMFFQLCYRGGMEDDDFVCVKGQIDRGMLWREIKEKFTSIPTMIAWSTLFCLR